MYSGPSLFLFDFGWAVGIFTFPIEHAEMAKSRPICCLVVSGTQFSPLMTLPIKIEYIKFPKDALVACRYKMGILFFLILIVEGERTCCRTIG